MSMSTPRIRYQTLGFANGLDLHIRSLWDKLQYCPTEGEEVSGVTSSNWSLFGVVWPAGLALARLMVDFDIDGKRILEIGCGLGIASLVLNHRSANITATDHHPSAESFLEANVALNDDPYIPFVRTGWSEENTELKEFDLVIGSDILYEAGNFDDLSKFVDRHIAPGGTAIIVDPQRGNAGRFIKAMSALGYESKSRQAAVGPLPDELFRGRVLTFSQTPSV